jgi:hypothetical protein
VKYRQKDVYLRDAEAPQVRTIERADGTTKVVLEFARDVIRGGVKTTTWYHVFFDLNIDEVSCVASTLVESLELMHKHMDESAVRAKNRVRSAFNG